MNYGERLRHARKLRKLSQDELAELSGVKQATISKIERGDQDGSSFDADLSMALKINPLWLSRGIGTMESYDAIDREQSPPVPVLNIKEWLELSPVQRIFIEDVLVKMKASEIDDKATKVLLGMIDIMSRDNSSNTTRRQAIHA